MKIAIGCDHAGINLKPVLIKYLEEKIRKDKESRNSRILWFKPGWNHSYLLKRGIRYYRIDRGKSLSCKYV